jgi:hypothetical protein
MGTNLALLQLMWTILNGSFLQSRGAIFPALKANGFTPAESHRIWGAFRHGVWRINECIDQWHTYVLAEGQWHSHSYEGYRSGGSSCKGGQASCSMACLDAPYAALASVWFVKWGK